MTKELIEEIKNVKLKKDDEIIDKLEQEWDIFLKDVNLLKSIDVSNVEPMSRVDDDPIDFLRQDIAQENLLSKKDFLANAPESHNGFVAIKKVVNHD